jgi:GNAT superfamily N-acetyltransferase
MPQIRPGAATSEGTSHIGLSPQRDSGLTRTAQLAILDGQPLSIRQARADAFGTIADMIRDAQERLKDLGTDQWSTDTPDGAGRYRTDRVKHSLREGTTWLAVVPVLQNDAVAEIPVATVTIEETANPRVWPERKFTAEPAVYLSRVVTAKGFSGLHVGAAIIDWAGEHGMNNYHAKWIRIDVWTTNVALHRYYEKRGFKKCDMVPNKAYPARMRFQRPTSQQKADGPKIIESAARIPCSGAAAGQIGIRQIETTDHIG